jgi:phosphoglycolate phosphatase
MRLMTEIEHKKHVVWDWNGTILNDVQHAVNTMNTLLDNHGLPLIDVGGYRKIFEFPIKNYYDKLGFDYSIRSFEHLCHDFVDHFMAEFGDCRPFDSVENILTTIKANGQEQSILSATDQDNLDKMIDHFEFDDHFDFVYGIENKFAASKIERGFELLKNSPISREETVLIGDTLHDLEVGEELGIDVILVAHGHQCQSILSRRHHTVISMS